MDKRERLERLLAAYKDGILDHQIKPIADSIMLLFDDQRIREDELIIMMDKLADIICKGKLDSF